MPSNMSLSSPSWSIYSNLGEGIRALASKSPVLVVGRPGCCMCHVAEKLLLGLGVNPAVCEVGDEIDDDALSRELRELDASSQQPQQLQMLIPAIFIGGRLVGGIDRLMAVHISGDLVPVLKEAGALWV